MINLKLLIIGIVSILVAVVGCRKTESINESIEPVVVDTISLTTYPTFTFSVNQVQISIDRRARLTGHLLNSYTGFSFAGLWIGAKQRGEERVNLLETSSSRMNSNYTLMWGDEYFGVYSITRDIVEKFCSNWPLDQGAPYFINSPRLYGEEMCWASYRPDTAASVPIYSKSIKGLRINFACFGYSDYEFSKIVFLKYQFTNIGYQSIQDMYAGFYIDPRLSTSGSSQEISGYDTDRSFAYVYSHKVDYNSSMMDVIGYTLLETPNNVNDQAVINSFRPITRGDDGDYGNYYIQVEEVYNALEGLKNTGQPIRNPVTGENTKYAYTGNPLTGEGWLDSPHDVRSLLNNGPFTIPVSESRNFIVCLIFEDGNSLEVALNKLKTKIDHMRKMPHLWKY